MYATQVTAEARRKLQVVASLQNGCYELGSSTREVSALSH